MQSTNAALARFVKERCVRPSVAMPRSGGKVRRPAAVVDGRVYCLHNVAFIGDSNAITVARQGRVGVAEAPVREPGGNGGTEKVCVSLPGLSTRLLGECSCEMEGFRKRTSDLPYSHLPRDSASKPSMHYALNLSGLGVLCHRR